MAVAVPDDVAVAEPVAAAVKVAVRESARAPAEGEAETGTASFTRATQKAVAAPTPSGSSQGLRATTAAAAAKTGVARARASATLAVDVTARRTLEIRERAPRASCRRSRDSPEPKISGRLQAVLMLSAVYYWRGREDASLMRTPARAAGAPRRTDDGVSRAYVRRCAIVALVGGHDDLRGRHVGRECGCDVAPQREAHVGREECELRADVDGGELRRCDL